MESFVYQYVVGGLVFVIGILAGLRSGELGWADRRRRHRLLVLVLGLGYFALLQGLLLLGSR